MHNCLHPTYLRLLLALLEDEGVPADSLLAGAGLTRETLHDSDAPVGVAQAIALLERAAEASAHPSLGLAWGERVSAAVHGPPGIAIAASASLGQACQVIARFGALRVGALSFAIQLTAEGAALQVSEAVALRGARVVLLEAAAVAIVRLLSSLVGQAVPGLVVELPFPAPAARAGYGVLNARRLMFGAPCLRLRLPAEALALRCVSADAALFDWACRECELLLGRAPPPAPDWTQRIRRALRANVGRYPTQAEMAARYGVSTRTFMRYLKREDTAYQQLLDEARKEQALWHLQRTRASIDTIAERLGYADAASFRRTFHRWFRISPSAMRGSA